MIPARACELIGQGVQTGLKKLKEIPPYKIPGPVQLTLLDSANHVPPFQELIPPVTADTISEAFLLCEKGMPWTSFDLQTPDGFIYP